MERSKENITVLIKQLTRVQTEYAKFTGAKLTDNTQEAHRLKDLSAGLNALHHIAGECQNPISAEPPGSIGNYVENWLDLAIVELDLFNKHGSHYVTSCSEALLKTHGVINIWHAAPATRKPIYFRGEHRYGHELKSRLGRKNFVESNQSPWGATPIELQLLSDYQSRVRKDRDLAADIFGDMDILPNDHPAWWAIMQHYDQTYGTRMLDITSSIFCALYFACAGWNGEVDTTTDGRLYI